MGRLGKLGLGVLIVIAIGIWDVGLPGQQSTSTGTAVTAPSVSPAFGSILPEPPPPAVPGVLQPAGQPDFVATFTGSRLDPHIWDTCYPWENQAGCTNYGNAGKELEWYVPGQVQVSDGMLHLVAERAPVAGRSSNGSPEQYACRSGMVTTYRGFEFQYGYLQIVAQIPNSGGLWPALWLAAENRQWPPEVDMLEAWGYGPGGPRFYAASYFHYKTPTGNSYSKAEVVPDTAAAGWHTFALSWTKTQMTWLLDGSVILTVRHNIPQQKMYLIANLAEWVSPQNPTVKPNQCNGSLNIRSVAVWPAPAA